MACVCVQDAIIKASEPARQLREYLQMSIMEAHIRILGCVRRRIRKIILQILPLFEPVSMISCVSVRAKEMCCPLIVQCHQAK